MTQIKNRAFIQYLFPLFFTFVLSLVLGSCGVSSLAYPNLLGTKKLGCCICTIFIEHKCKMTFCRISHILQLARSLVSQYLISHLKEKKHILYHSKAQRKLCKIDYLDLNYGMVEKREQIGVIEQC
jgi:hypothetical protein